ncbi:MAG: U32 family peptidase [Nanoarchaeota archaeon]|nr:U32 family peptidase [Nanoarchaeota archaeon]
MKKPELLAPCHDWPTLIAAVEAGADAVYFGVERFNMRLKAKNFNSKDLPKIVNYCHENKVKSYLTINSIIYEPELKSAKELVKKAKQAGVDALIIHDLALIPICKIFKIPFHISTQASVSNSASANLFKQLGASRVILAREVQLKDLKKIVKNSKIPVEVFIHGAMCVSVSGRCFFSLSMYGESANRGECMQPCRQKWTVKNEDAEMVYDGERFLNAKDLCTITFLDKLIKTGVSSLKIEGRRKDANYVNTVVSVYREAIDDYSKKKLHNWLERLKSVFNRGFSTGFYLGKPKPSDVELKSDGTTSTHRKQAVGVVKNYYPKAKAAEVYLNHAGLKIGDTIIFEGKTTFLKQEIESMQISKKTIKKSVKGQRISLKIDSKVRKNDQVYVVKKI